MLPLNYGSSFLRYRYLKLRGHHQSNLETRLLETEEDRVPIKSHDLESESYD